MTSETNGQQADVAIIGGGASGALTALHLLRQRPGARVVVFDSRPQLGLGLAYSTPSLRHLLNVPAGKISALPAQPHHFLNWLRTHKDAGATEATFAPRAVFGAYLRDLLAQEPGIRHVRATVQGLMPLSGGAALLLDDGRQWHAKRVVLATGNFDPARLAGIAPESVAQRLYIDNAWRDDAFSGLDVNATVSLIGTGLTAIDVLLRLRETGHRGPVIAVSRHGVFPHRHAACTPAWQSAIPAGTQPSCVAYLRVLRAAIAEGIPWRAAVDSLRATTNDLWRALTPAEQRRFRRHLQRRWEVVRHRMAPAIADVLDAERVAGTLLVRKGHLRSVSVASTGAQVTLRSTEGEDTLIAARVINCTGPEMQYRRVPSPLLQQLLTQGVACAGPLGAGLATTDAGALLDSSGQASPLLFTLGPSRQGALLESIAIPELRRQAFDLASLLAQDEDVFAAEAGEGVAA